MSRLPRAIIISTTSADSGSASGRCIEALFSRWPRADVAQIVVRQTPAGARASADGTGLRTFELGDDPWRCDVLPVLQRWLEDFRPEVAYVRAAENPERWWSFGPDLAERLGIPFALHVFDDVVEWQARCRSGHGAVLGRIRRDIELEMSLAAAGAVFACTDEALDHLVGSSPVVRAAFVRPIEASTGEVAATRGDHDLAIAYTGRCNPVQHAEGFVELAEVVLGLRGEGHDVVIRASGPNQRDFERVLGARPDLADAVEVVGDLSTVDERARLVASCDAVAITLNRSAEGVGYSRRSLSSKALDAVATDKAVLVHGSAEMFSLRWVRDLGWADATSTLAELDALLRRWLVDRTVPAGQLTARRRLRQEWSPESVLGRFEARMTGLVEVHGVGGTDPGPRDGSASLSG